MSGKWHDIKMLNGVSATGAQRHEIVYRCSSW